MIMMHKALRISKTSAQHAFTSQRKQQQKPSNSHVTLLLQRVRITEAKRKFTPNFLLMLVEETPIHGAKTNVEAKSGGNGLPNERRHISSNSRFRI
jgi:hypothetical protein